MWQLEFETYNMSVYESGFENPYPTLGPTLPVLGDLPLPYPLPHLPYLPYPAYPTQSTLPYPNISTQLVIITCFNPLLPGRL